MASLAFTVVVNKKTRRPQSVRQTAQKRSYKHSNRRPIKSRKKFCKCCFDAGKDEVVYTNHYLKDKPGPQGKVVCPTLLSTECRYCHVTGHYKSHCPVLKERNNTRPVAKPTTHASFASDALLARIKAAEANITFRQKKKQTKPAKKNKNAFAALEEDDDDRKLSPVPTVVEPVALQGKWMAPLNSRQPSDHELFALKRAHTIATAVTPVVEQCVTPPQDSARSPTPKLWGDMSSDEESDDEEEITYDANGFPSVDNSAW